MFNPIQKDIIEGESSALDFTMPNEKSITAL